MFKTELGVVYYMTYKLEFPDDTYWIRQEPFTGSLSNYLSMDSKTLPAQARNNLVRDGKAAFKDHNGVWIHLQVNRKHFTDSYWRDQDGNKVK